MRRRETQEKGTVRQMKYVREKEVVLAPKSCNIPHDSFLRLPEVKKRV